MRRLIVTIFVMFSSISAFAGGAGSGGGQGLYDLATGQVHFVDLFTSGELSKMQIAKNPERYVFSKFPNCTKVTSKPLSKDFYYQDAFNLLAPFINEVFGDLEHRYGFHKSDFLNSFSYLFRTQTALHLKQLRDTKQVAPESQLQLAIYRDGVSVFQEQALALMPPDEIKWLTVKEALRYYVTSNYVPIENPDIEEAVRLIYHNDVIGFKNSNYLLKIMRPNYLGDYQNILRAKMEFLETRLKEPSLPAIQKDLLVKYVTDLHKAFSQMEEKWGTQPGAWGFISKEYIPPGYDDQAELTMSQDDNICGIERTWSTLKERSHMYKECLDYGYVPLWAANQRDSSSPMNTPGDQGLITRESTKEAPVFRGFDIETGRVVSDLFGHCSK